MWGQRVALLCGDIQVLCFASWPELTHKWLSQHTLERQQEGWHPLAGASPSHPKGCVQHSARSRVRLLPTLGAVGHTQGHSGGVCSATGNREKGTGSLQRATGTLSDSTER